ncbi:TorD/DmsD family molecular chaperone [Shewanella fidelis]|uniref:Molecular chaperone TorD family protein n=1 Tax=Shewanella fidelis TaxID=173509 RepID=A0AAW8NRP8_9GAMM|nr:molecular chaperone TorD family protein [Shewanella fidelis]MDR8525475.1 molecular chaperone TorD family protein [Shewanella fidelis]MDW4813206.1 molecular chaperone TorD family protein [Shewanella fidelis]MDW4816914.1 molecular chaperone TorD family protein [Shewanella fidelis]MDW4820073.1 molecular chaperone TorD family protein [Shewanella fidelis]MDW4825671.1 molecular chaperone TorD family protein [Shewanella fidelis]
MNNTLAEITPILAANMYHAPSDKMLEMYQENDFNLCYPLLTESKTRSEGVALISNYMKQYNTEQLPELQLDFNQLFIGPGKMKVPLWGSYYLSEDNLLCGQSTQKLQQFTDNLGIKINTIDGDNQPIDHLSLVLQLVQYTIKQNKTHEHKVIIADHLAPWAYRVAELTMEHAQTDFYLGWGLLLKDYLDVLIESNGIIVQERTLWG